MPQYRGSRDNKRWRDRHKSYKTIYDGTPYDGKLSCTVWSGGKFGNEKSKNYLSLLGQIPDFNKKISTVRSRGIGIIVIFQNLAQLQNRYPLGVWEEILGNCDTQLFLGCTDQTTAEYISTRTGEATVDVSSQAKGLKTLRITDYTPEMKQSESVGKRKLLTPDEVLTMEKNHSIIFLKGNRPLEVEKFWTNEHPAYEELEPIKATQHITNRKQRELDKEAEIERKTQEKMAKAEARKAKSEAEEAARKAMEESKAAEREAEKAEREAESQSKAKPQPVPENPKAGGEGEPKANNSSQSNPKSDSDGKPKQQPGEPKNGKRGKSKESPDGNPDANSNKDTNGTRGENPNREPEKKQAEIQPTAEIPEEQSENDCEKSSDGEPLQTHGEPAAKPDNAVKPVSSDDGKPDNGETPSPPVQPNQPVQSKPSGQSSVSAYVNAFAGRNKETTEQAERMNRKLTEKESKRSKSGESASGSSEKRRTKKNDSKVIDGQMSLGIGGTEPIIAPDTPVQTAEKTKSDYETEAIAEMNGFVPTEESSSEDIDGFLF